MYVKIVMIAQEMAVVTEIEESIANFMLRASEHALYNRLLTVEICQDVNKRKKKQVLFQH